MIKFENSNMPMLLLGTTPMCMQKMNSILTNIANRNYRANHSGLILQKKFRKFAENKQTNRQTDKQTENSKPEATLIPCGSSG